MQWADLEGVSPRDKRKRMVEEERDGRMEKMAKLEKNAEKDQGDAIVVESDEEGEGQSNESEEEQDTMEVDSEEETVIQDVDSEEEIVIQEVKGIGQRRQGKGRVVVKAINFSQRLREL